MKRNIYLLLLALQFTVYVFYANCTLALTIRVLILFRLHELQWAYLLNCALHGAYHHHQVPSDGSCSLITAICTVAMRVHHNPRLAPLKQMSCKRRTGKQNGRDKATFATRNIVNILIIYEGNSVNIKASKMSIIHEK